MSVLEPMIDVLRRTYPYYGWQEEGPGVYTGLIEGRQVTLERDVNVWRMLDSTGVHVSASSYSKAIDATYKNYRIRDGKPVYWSQSQKK